MLWRGELRSPSNPCLSRRCRSTWRTRDPRTGARLAQRRAAVVASHVTQANQAAVGAAEALQVPNVGERANEAVSGLQEARIAALVRIEDHPAAEDLAGRRLHPPEGGFVAFPQGSLAPKARAGTTPNMTEAVTEGTAVGAVDPSIGGGSFQAPLSAQKRRLRSGNRRRIAREPWRLRKP